MCNGSTRGEQAPHIVDNRGKKALPIGVENFDAVVRTGVYVDKTLLIRDLLDGVQGSTTLFCRPRRFGKSLAMRMLQCFFEAPVEGLIASKRQLFENLAIWGEDEYYRAEQGAHPVIYLTLGAANGASWEEVRRRIAGSVAAEYSRHRYLYDSPLLFANERSMFERLACGQGSNEELERSLAWLSSLLHQYHGSETVILIDEYDRPITEGYLGGFREETTHFMRTWLTDALKGTVDLRLACVTGVQRVSKEPIFSDLNNLTVDTPLSERHAESFGFTEAEAEALAAYMGLPAEKLPEMREWYDGYCFGGVRVYNPISTLRYLQERTAQPYWTNTSGNAVVTRLFQRADLGLNARLQRLARGGTVEAPLDMQVVFGEIDSDTSAVWSQLYLGGYLTTDDVEFPEAPRSHGICACRTTRSATCLPASSSTVPRAWRAARGCAACTRPCSKATPRAFGRYSTPSSRNRPRFATSPTRHPATCCSWGCSTRCPATSTPSRTARRAWATPTSSSSRSPRTPRVCPSSPSR